MKKWILMLLLLGANGWSLAQTQNMSGDLTKYWYYRWRLRNDFMVMGNGPGQSLVAEARNFGRRDLVMWADASLMQGYYLSMLAIEHRILSDMERNEDLKNNERELYFALKAFERLDYWTETIYSDEQPNNNDDGYRQGDLTMRGDVNGYFYRDDVPPNFFTETPNLSYPNEFYSNYYSINNMRTGIRYHTNSLGEPVFPHHAEGDYENHYKQSGSGSEDNECYLCPPDIGFTPYLPIVNHKKGREGKWFSLGEMSQDQAIRVILGCVTIVKSIPNEEFAIDTDKDGIADVIFNFVDQARRHATNILGRAFGYRSGTITVPPDDVQLVLNASMFLGPLACWNTQGPRNLDVEFGDYTLYAHPLRKISPLLFTGSNDLEIVDPLYNQPLQGLAFEQYWKYGIASGYNNDNNSHMSFLLNVMANSGPISDLNVQSHLYTKSKQLDKDALYMPFYEYLWGWNGNQSSNKQATYGKAQQWLHDAPCVGPHNFGNVYTLGEFSPDHVNNGIPLLWNQAFLYDADKHEWDDGRKGENNDFYEGWFSGLDYLLLYNTVYSNLTTERPMYHDLINRIVDYPIYTSNSTNMIEYSVNGLLIGAFENMQIRNIISGNAPVDVKALEYIELQNGAYIDPETSGVIDIYPDKLTCNTGSSNGVYRLDQCTTCSLEEAMDLSIVPSIKEPIRSITTEDYLLEESSVFSPSSLESSELVVYPNPATDKFHILGGEVLDVDLVDALGNKIPLLGDILNGYDIKELVAGIYFVHIKTLEHDEVIKITKR